LPFGKKSGLSIAKKILSGIEGIGIYEFTERDVVRHPLVRRIISAYEKYERENQTAKKFRADGKDVKR
jgi:phosphate starvation-inducible PhoH-like protein